MEPYVPAQKVWDGKKQGEILRINGLICLGNLLRKAWYLFGPKCNGTLWLFTIAMGNGPFIEVYLLKMVIFHGYVK
jgi:hypothetical protein